MEGIKKDILIANKLARMQSEIDALTPADCDALCAAVASAQDEVETKTTLVEDATEAANTAQDELNVATDTLEAAQATYDDVLENNTACLEGCEPPPEGDECISGCNEEYNVEAAQTDLDEAQGVFDDAQTAYDAAAADLVTAENSLETAQAALNEAQNAAEDAGCVC